MLNFKEIAVYAIVYISEMKKVNCGSGKLQFLLPDSSPGL
jgi:hypothetical protein